MPDERGDGKRFFIAHSSRQKEFALALRDALEADAWIDLHEIDVGDVLLDEIAAGIQAASDFVLLWSRDSASSRWVMYESHMAFVRYLEDEAINIRVVCLDDTPVPLHLRPLLQARHLEEPGDVAAVLLGAPPVGRTLRAFVNRNADIGALEELLYARDRGIMWYVGVAGIGKRAVAREGLRRLIADASRTARIAVRRGTEFVELHLAICEVLAVEPPKEPLSDREAKEAALALVESFAREGGVWLFEEVQHWLDEDASPNRVLREVLRALSAAGGARPEHGAIFTSTRRPSLDDIANAISEIRPIRGLSSGFAVALLQARGADGSEDGLRAAATQLDGHPLALELAVGVLNDESLDWEEQRATTAQTVLGGLSLGEGAQSLLESLAGLDGPLPGDQLAEHLSLSANEYGQAVGEASSYALVEERDGFLRIHPLIRDFFLRVLRRRNDYRDRMADLAERSREFLRATSRGSTVHVDALLTSFRLLSLGGRMGEALELHRTLFGTLLETAIDLYNERRHDEALRYLEVVIDSTEDNKRAKLYAARSLAYLGRGGEARKLVDQLLQVNPTDAELLRVCGRIEFILRDWPAALAYFERARQRRPNSVAILRDLGQVNIRLERWEDARLALQRAMEGQHPGGFVRSYYSQVLERFGEFDEARSVIEPAIRADPDNPIFHHRLGRIALRQGDVAVARRELARALELDPRFHEAGVSLASLLVDEGDTDEARELLKRVEQMPGVRPALLHTIKAKLLLAEGDCAAARDLVYRALAAEREPESVLLALRVEIQCFATSGHPPERLRASTEPLLNDLRAMGLDRAAGEWTTKVNEELR